MTPKRLIEITNITENIINVEGQLYKKHNLEERELKIIEELVHVIDKLVSGENKHQKVRLVLTQNISQSKIIIMSLAINSNQFSIGSLALVDSDTGNQVAATFSGTSFSGSNDGAFTVSPDASDPSGNTARVTGVAAGSGSVSASTTANYTDANTGQPVSKTLTVSVDVTVAAIVAGENVSLQLNFSAPQNS